ARGTLPRRPPLRAPGPGRCAGGRDRAGAGGSVRRTCVTGAGVAAAGTGESGPDPAGRTSARTGSESARRASFVVATAGHVDHGKSTLVRALTGIEPDRWDEERRRGLTIDLGFAWTTLPSGRTVSFVDVPGHERFLGNMLAGVGPAPIVLFIVAADEGWQSQSADHRDAIAALGITQGLLVVTRADLAPDRVEEVLAEARTELAGTGLAEAPAVSVSALTGQGMGQ